MHRKGGYVVWRLLRLVNFLGLCVHDMAGGCSVVGSQLRLRTFTTVMRYGHRYGYGYGSLNKCNMASDHFGSVPFSGIEHVRMQTCTHLCPSCIYSNHNVKSSDERRTSVSCLVFEHRWLDNAHSSASLQPRILLRF